MKQKTHIKWLIPSVFTVYGDTSQQALIFKTC